MTILPPGRSVEVQRHHRTSWPVLRGHVTEIQSDTKARCPIQAVLWLEWDTTELDPPHVQPRGSGVLLPRGLHVPLLLAVGARIALRMNDPVAGTTVRPYPQQHILTRRQLLHL